MPDSKRKKPGKNTGDHVNFSVRFDPVLFGSIESTLLAIPRPVRPSKDKFIQDAVAEKVREVSGGGTGTAPFDSHPNDDIKSHPIALQGEQWARAFAHSLLGVVDQYRDKLESLAIDGAAAQHAGEVDLSSKVTGVVGRSEGAETKAHGSIQKHRGNRKAASGNKKRAG